MHAGTGGGNGAPPSPQQFCLRWNNYQSNLTNVFDQLLQSESFVDVTLACEGHSVKAHKMVLSACSPYFQSLFFDNPCQHPIVILKDIKWPELKAVVEFMYKGEINVSQEQIGPLLKVAESLKIRGLADVNGEQDLGKGLEDVSLSRKKRRRNSTESCSPGEDSEPLETRALELVTTSPPTPQPATPQNQQGVVPLPLAPPPPPPPVNQGPPPEDMEIKPGIAEMIREEERIAFNHLATSKIQPLLLTYLSVGTVVTGFMSSTSGECFRCKYTISHHSQGVYLQTRPEDGVLTPKALARINRHEASDDGLHRQAKMLESSHAWLGASTSSLAADSYQYQLQSMWQKCWNTNQSLVHNLRFRERGPLKSWRPETMAEAILSVLKEGLSLSQAARKYDIPYPTFVLYANRVHNMLGPSADGGSDLRPKGRGRPQRILLGIWPEDHIRGVIRAVVFRDPQHMKDEAINLGYHRLPVRNMSPKSQLCTPDSVHSYGSGGGSGGGGSSGPGSVTDSVSPNSAAAAVVAVAQNLRQQMLAAAHHHEQHPQFPGFLAAAAAHCGNGAASLMLHSPSPVDSSPRSSPLTQPNNNMEMAMNMGYKPMVNDSMTPRQNEHLFQDEIEDLVKRPQASETPKPQPMVYKPMPNDLSTRADHLFQDEMDLMKRPQQGEPPKVKVGIGVSGMAYKGGCEGYGPPRSDSLLQDEFENLVKSPPQPQQKEPIHMSVDQRTE